MCCAEATRGTTAASATARRRARKTLRRRCTRKVPAKPYYPTMRDIREPVQPGSGAMKKSLPSRYTRRRLAMLAVWLIGYCALACEQAASAEDNAPKSKVEPGAAEDQPSRPAGPTATIEGFRQARFGMSEEQV